VSNYSGKNFTFEPAYYIHETRSKK